MSDQAAGLRSLFARRRPSLLIVAGSEPMKGAVAAHFASEAATAGRATVLVDGSAGEVAIACGVSCRYELAHVVSGDKALADVLKVLTPHLLLLPAARALSRFGSFSADEQARLEQAFSTGIAEAYANAGATEAQVDLIVVNAEVGRASRAIDAFGRDARVVIVASDRAASLRGAYLETKILSQQHGLEHFEIVVPASGDTAGSGVTFANLANAARRFLDIDVVDGGTVAIASSYARRTAPTHRATSNEAASELAAASVLPTPSLNEASHAAIA
jgi:MinD-like ATPase involved in chromosome partitioning or flagellar assembly